MIDTENALLVAWSIANIVVALYGVFAYASDARIFRQLARSDTRRQLPLHHLLLGAQGLARGTVFLVYAYTPPDALASEWRRSLIDDLVGLPTLLSYTLFLPRRFLLAVPRLSAWRVRIPFVVGVPAGGLLLTEIMMLASATNASIDRLQLLTSARNWAYTTVAMVAVLGYVRFTTAARSEPEERTRLQLPR